MLKISTKVQYYVDITGASIYVFVNFFVNFFNFWWNSRKKQVDTRLSGSIIGCLDFDSFFSRLARPDWPNPDFSLDVSWVG